MICFTPAQNTPYPQIFIVSVAIEQVACWRKISSPNLSLRKHWERDRPPGAWCLMCQGHRIGNELEP